MLDDVFTKYQIVGQTSAEQYDKGWRCVNLGRTVYYTAMAQACADHFLCGLQLKSHLKAIICVKLHGSNTEGTKKRSQPA